MRASRAASFLRYSHPVFLLATWPAALTSLVACDQRDDAGVIHVDELPLLVVEPSMRIGDFDDPDLGFTRVSGVEVDHEGNIYVLEGLTSEIRVYSAEGALLRRIGRQGGGPGEFENPPRFGITGDTLWAVDAWANRITLFDREGTVLSTGTIDNVTVQLPSGFGYVLPQMMRPDGKFIGHLSRVGYSRDDHGPEVKPTDSIPVPFVLFDARGAVTDTVGWAGRPPPRMWRPPSEESPPPDIIEVGGRRIWVPSGPTTLPSWLPVTDGYVVVETPLAETAEDGVFTVTRIGLEGDTVYHLALHYSPAAYSSEDLDSIAVWAARGEPGGMVPYVPGQGPPADWEVIARHIRGAMEFPVFQLPVEYPWLAQDEGLWLRQTDEARPETVDWILLDPEGRPRGQLELPSEVRISWSRGDTFWAAVPDEYDVPWVVRYRIRPASGARESADDRRR
jgi:hypothetical protein